ncbi:MAG: acyl-CoA dehydrogenase family protein [Chloroflexi bacterium]|nr:acyl-CoA dehydrogenase family protein [Chloroflexota bacterium]
MDFTYHYTKEQEEFRQEIRTWLERNIPKDMRAPVDRSALTDEQFNFWREMGKTLAAKGWLYSTYPKEYGGGGLTGAHETIIMEEFDKARVIAGFTISYVFPTLLVWANEEQKEKFLTPLLKLEKVASQLFTEPGAGSDLASLQSRAVRDGDDWILNGQKTFIGGRAVADYLMGLFITDPDAPRHRNLGLFMVPFPSEGLEQRRIKLLTGNDSSFYFLDNVRIPGDHLIGGDHQGWQVAQTTLEIEHGGRGAAFPRDEALENLLKYVRQTEYDGHTIGADPILQQRAMEAFIDSKIFNLYSKRNYWMYQARQEMSYHGSQSALYGKVFRMTNADRARDILGMYSLLGVREPRAPFGGQQEVYQRSSLTGAHPGGTIEVQKVIMARRIGISRTRERAAPTPSSAGVSGV